MEKVNLPEIEHTSPEVLENYIAGCWDNKNDMAGLRLFIDDLNRKIKKAKATIENRLVELMADKEEINCGTATILKRKKKKEITNNDEIFSLLDIDEDKQKYFKSHPFKPAMCRKELGEETTEISWLDEVEIKVLTQNQKEFLELKRWAKNGQSTAKN